MNIDELWDAGDYCPQLSTLAPLKVAAPLPELRALRAGTTCGGVVETRLLAMLGKRELLTNGRFRFSDAARCEF